MSDTSLPTQFELPLLPLRDLVVFPHMVVPLIVGRTRSRTALSAADKGDRQIFLAAQKNGRTADPGEDDIFTMGTVANIHQMLRLPDENLKVLVEGQQRAKIVRYIDGGDHLRVVVELVAEQQRPDVEVEALMRSVKTAFEQYVKLNKGVPPEMLLTVASIDEPGRLGDTLVAHLGFKHGDRQELLEQLDVSDRLERILLPTTSSKN